MVKVALVGYGYWGTNILRAFNEIETAQVVACCDTRIERLDLIKKRYPSITVTSNFEDVLRDPEILAVVIATPLSKHYELAEKALKKKKHVWIEKPMTENSVQAKRLVVLAKRSSMILFVDHIFLYTKAVAYLKKFIDSGKLGKVYYFDSTRINLGIFQPDNNVIWDLATHDISIMCFLLNKYPTAVSAVGSSHIKPNVEDVAYLNFWFDNSTSAHISVSWLSPVKIRRTLIAGSKKMITYDDLETSEKIKVYDYGVSVKESYHPASSVLGHQYRTGDIHSPALESMEALQAAAKHFIDCIKKRKQPLTNGQEGYKVVKILEAASKSLQEEGRFQKVSIKT